MRPYNVDWLKLRADLDCQRYEMSYREMSEQIPGVSASTLFRFISKESELDLTSLLAVVSYLQVDITLYIYPRAKQLSIF